MDTTDTAQPRRRVSRWTYVIIVVATVLLTLSTIGGWVETVMLDQEGFTALTADTLTTEESRAAIAQELVNQVEQRFREIPAAVREPLEAALAGLLNISLVRSALEIASDLLWQALFVNQGAVILDVTPLRGFIDQIISAVDAALGELIEITDLPTEITLLQQGQLPDLEPYRNLVLWITSLFFLTGAGLLTFVFIRYRRPRPQLAKLLSVSGWLIVGQGILLVILPVLLRPLVAGSVTGPTGRAITEEAYDKLIAELHIQLVLPFIVGIALFIAGTLLAKRHLQMQPAPPPELAVSPETP